MPPFHCRIPEAVSQKYTPAATDRPPFAHAALDVHTSLKARARRRLRSAHRTRNESNDPLVMQLLTLILASLAASVYAVDPLVINTPYVAEAPYTARPLSS